MSPQRQPKPTVYTDVNGVQRLHGRRTGFVLVGRDAKGAQQFRLYCPETHRVDLDGLPVFADRPIRCTHREQRGGPECGISLQLIARVRSMKDDEMILAVEVTPDELHWMEKHHIDSAPALLAFLGMVWPKGRER